MSALIVAGEEGVEECASLIRDGGIAGVPTETVYGLAADAFQPLAVAAIFEAKGRPLTDPLIVHLPEGDWLERVALLNSQEERRLVERLAAAWWPGALTMLLQKQPDIPELVTAGSDRVAVRVTSHPLFQQVIRKVGSPLAAPSANRFGRISPVCAQDVQSELGDSISLILDGGSCQHGLESTIVALSAEGIEILRPGPITREQLTEYGHVGSGKRFGNTPGKLPGHYAPKKRLSFMDRDIHELAGSPDALSLGLLAFKQPPSEVSGCFGHVRVLSPSGDLREAASRLYTALRDLDESSVTQIVVERVPSEGIGMAIMDRLQRASYGSHHGTGHQEVA